MNKKILIVPTIMLSMVFTTSCGGDNWATIDSSDAKDLVESIIKEEISGFSNFPKMMELNYSNDELTSFLGHSSNVSKKHIYKYDYDNKFCLYYDSRDMADLKAKEDIANFYLDGYGYELNNIYFNGRKRVYDEEKWMTQNTINAISTFSRYLGGVYYKVFLGVDNFDSLIKAYDTLNETLKELNGYFKYTFTSSDKTKNLGIKIEKSFTIPEDKESEIAETYESDTLEIKFENNYPISYTNHYNVQIAKFNDEPEINISTDVNCTLNYTNRHSQNYNLSDYYITEAK